MAEEIKTEKKKWSRSRKAVIGILSAVIAVALVVSGVILLKENTYPEEGAAEEQLRQQLMDSSTKEITVNGTLYLHGPVTVSGEKTIKGDGKLKSVGFWYGESSDYLLVLEDNAKLTLSGDITLDCNGRSGGVLVAEGTVLQLQEQATVSNAHKKYSNVASEGAFIMAGGFLKDAKGHNLRVSGAATIGGGEIVGSGKGYAGVYNEGTLEQSGGTVRDAYDNIYVAAGADFIWSGGDNNAAVNDGILVAEGGALTTTSLGAMMNDAGKQGIHLYGKAVVEDVFLLGSGENQIKIESTGDLTLINGAFDGSLGHGITNRGKMVMSGGEVTNSAQAGIVCTGELEITGGRVYASEEVGVLIRNGSNVKLHGETFSATGNSVGVLVEENAYAEVFNCNISANDIYNFGSYGELYLHDLTTGGSGSNCIAAQYGGKIKAENIVISGTVANNGIYNVNGSTVELYNVTIDAAKTNGIRSLDATLIAEGLTVTNCGGAGISMGDYELQGAGKIQVNNVTMDSNGGANIALDVNCTGTAEVSNASLGKSGSNNISAKGGYLILNNVELLGNIEKDASNHGILLDEGCKITATNLLIRDTLKSGMRIRGGDFEGTNVTMENLGAAGISSVTGPTNKRNGTIIIDGLRITGAKENTVISDCDGNIIISNATLGATWSNNVRINNGSVTLTNTKVLGHTAQTKSEAEHAVFITKGSLTMKNVDISNSKSAGLRFGGGTVEADGLTIQDSGSSAIYTTSVKGDDTGKLTLKNLTVTGSGDTNLTNSGEVSVSVVGGTFGPAYSNNIRINTGSVYLENVEVQGQLEKTRNDTQHGLFITNGSLEVKNVTVRDAEGAGLRFGGGTVTGEKLTIENSGGSGLYNTSNKDVEGSLSLKELNISGSNDTNITHDSTYPVTVVGGTFGPARSNNLRIHQGTVSLENVTVDGQTEESLSGTQHGVFISGGELGVNNVTVQNAEGAGVRHNGGNVIGQKLTVINSGASGIDSSDKTDAEGKAISNTGIVEITALNISGSGFANIINSGAAVITADGGKLGTAYSNNIRISNGVVTLKAVAVEAHDPENVSEADVHGVMIDGGSLNLEGVIIANAKVAGIRHRGGTVNATSLTITGAGGNGISSSNGSTAGSITVTENLTISQSGQCNIHIDGNNQITVSGGTFGKTLNSNNVRATAGTVVLQNVTIEGTQNDGHHGIFTSHSGQVTAENVTVTDASDALRVDGGTIEFTGGKLDGSRRHGAYVSKGVLNLADTVITGSGDNGIYSTNADSQFNAVNVQISDTKYNGISMDGGAARLTQVTVTDSGANGLRLVGGSLSGENITVTNPGKEKYGIYVSGGNLEAVNVTVSGARNTGIYGEKGAGNVSISGLKLNETGASAKNNINLLSTYTGTMTLTDVVTGPSVSGNIVVGGGTMHLNNATVNGTVEAHHGIHLNGGTLNAHSITVKNAREAIYVSSGTGTVSNASLESSKRNGISIGGGSLTLENSAINGTAANGVASWGQGNLLLNNVSLSGHANSGIQLDGGNVSGQDIAIHMGENAKYGIYVTGGNMTDAGNVTVSGAKHTGIYAEKGAGNVTVTGLRINETEASANNNIYLANTYTGTMTLTDVVTGPSVYANVIIGGGTLNLNSAAVNGTVDKHHGIHLNGGTLNAHSITVKNAREAIYVSSGSGVVKNSTLESSKRNGISIGGGSLEVIDSAITGSAASGADVWGEAGLKLTNVTVSGSGSNGVQVSGGNAVLNNVGLTEFAGHGIQLFGGNVSGDGITVDTPSAEKVGILVTNGNMTDVKNVILSGVKHIGIYGEKGTGNVSITGLRINETEANAINNIVLAEAYTGTMTLTDVTTGPSVYGNVIVSGGTLNLNSAQVNGTVDKHHGIHLNGGTLNADRISVSNAREAIYVSSGSGVVKNSTLESSKRHGISIGGGTLELTNSVITGAASNGIESWGEGKLILNGVSIGEVAAHGVCINGGAVEMANSSVTDAPTNGILINGGSLRADGITVSGGREAIYVSSGSGIVSNAILENTTRNGISIGGGSLELIGSTISGAATNGIDCWGTAQLTANGVTVHQPGSHGINMSGGRFTLEGDAMGITIQQPGANGIVLNGGEISGKGITVNNPGAENYGIFVANGSMTEVSDVVITGVQKVGIQAGKSGEESFTGNVTINGLLINEAEGNAVNNIVLDRSYTGTVSLTNVTAGPSVNGNIVVSGGTMNLNNATVNGTVDKHHGIHLNGGILNADGIIVSNAREALYVSSGTGIVKNSSLEKSKRNGISIGGGSLTLENSVITGSAASGADVWGEAGLTLTNVTVRESGSNGVQVSGGNAALNNVDLTGFAGHGIQLFGGNVTGDGITVDTPSAEKLGILVTAGNMTDVKNVYLNGISNVGIYAEKGAGNVTVTGLRINENDTNAHNNIYMANSYTGTMTLTDVVTGPSVYGNIVVGGGTMNLNNATVNGTVNMHHGIHLNGGTLNADSVTVKNARESIYVSSGTGVVKNSTLESAKRHGVGVGGGTLALDNVKISGAAQDGINIWGGAVELTDTVISGSGKNGILAGANTVVTFHSGSVYGNTALDINAQGSLSIGAITVGFDPEGVDLGGAVKSGKTVAYLGTAAPGSVIRLDASGKQTGDAMVKFESADGANALKDSFQAVGGTVNDLYLTGDTLYLGQWVAQVGTQKYLTLEEAFAAANALDSATVTLLANAAITDTVAITGNVTVADDGNPRKLIRGTDAPLFEVTGTLNLTGTAGSMLTVDGAGVAATGTGFAVSGKINVTNVDIKNMNSGAWSGNALFYLRGGSLASFSSVNISGGSGQMFYIQGAGLEGAAHSFTGCTFKDYAGTANGSVFNSASGAKVTVTGCTFENIKNGAHGGVIYVDRSTYNISDSVFRNNACGTAGGGAITVSNQAGSPNILNLTNCQFIGNTAGKGGAIWLRSNTNSRTAITGCTFENNQSTANNGGAILADQNVNLTVDGGSFSGNTASTQKGNDIYIYIADSAKHILRATDATLIAEVYIDSGAVQVAGTLKEGSSLTLNWNTVPTGTAVLLDSADTAAANFESIKLADSLAANYHLSYSGNTASLVSGAASYKAMIGAEGYGSFEAALTAAIAASDEETAVTIRLVDDVTVSETVTIPAGGNIVITDDGTERKLIRNTNGVMLEVSGSLSLMAAGENTLIIDGNGIAATGNAIRVNGTLNADGIVIDGLKGGTYASAMMWMNTGSLVVVENATVKNTSGNVIYAQGAPAADKNHTFLSCIFQNNSAGAAGAVFNSAKNARFTITGCSFESNTATGHGGAIYCDQSTYVITDSSFTGNKTTGGHGGAITASAHASANVTIGNCQFANNSSKDNANGKGGAVWARANSTVTITDSAFTGNTSSKEGPAICCDANSNVTIDGTKVSGSSTVAINNDEQEGQ